MGASATDVQNYVKPEIVPVYKYTAEIDITPKGASRTWADLCAGFNNISEAMNEVVQQYFFLCGSGHGVNFVTGMAPSMTMSGVRVIGDAAQDFIFSKKYELMSERDTRFRLTRHHEDGTTDVVSANVTFANLSDVSGGTTDGSAISLEMRFNGKPYLGDAWSTAATSYVVTQRLTNVDTDYTNTSVAAGGAVAITLTAEAGHTMASVVVTMGGEDVTADVYNSETGKITITAASGTIIVVASAVEE